VKSLLFITLLYGSSVMANFDKKVEEIVIKYKIPSLSVMILSHDKTILHSVYGVRKIGENDKVSKIDSFHLGSCAKAFTATLILKLFEEGKLSLDDSITKYLSSLDKIKFQEIKIKHLLSHTGGIAGNVEGAPWAEMFSFDITPSQGRELAIKYLNSAKVIGKPGVAFLYSNLGYMVLGQIIESIEKKSFELVLSEKFFNPLGMKSCTFGPAGRTHNIPAPWAHHYENGKYTALDPKLIESDNPPAMSPAGGISCNQEDWAKFLSFVMNVGEHRAYLKPATRAYISKTNLEEYTYGAWGKLHREWGGTLLTHSGSNTLNYSSVVLGLEKKFAFLINTNSPSAEAVLEVIPFLKDFYLNYEDQAPSLR